MRKLVVAVVAALAVAGLSVGIAWAATPHAARPAPRQPVHRVLWVGAGPDVGCNANGCDGGIVEVPFRMPGSGTYLASVTISFQYHTVGNAEFGLDSPLGGHRVLPRQRALGTSANPTSATLVFRTHLRGGHQYYFSPAVDAVHTSARYRIATDKMMIEVDATPSAAGAKLAMHPRVIRHTVQRGRN